MNGYVVFFSGKRAEVQASSLSDAKEQACKLFKVSKSKRSLVSVVLAEVDGKQVVHSTASI